MTSSHDFEFFSKIKKSAEIGQSQIYLTKI